MTFEHDNLKLFLNFVFCFSYFLSKYYWKQTIERQRGRETKRKRGREEERQRGKDAQRHRGRNVKTKKQKGRHQRKTETYKDMKTIRQKERKRALTCKWSIQQYWIKSWESHADNWNVIVITSIRFKEVPTKTAKTCTSFFFLLVFDNC